MVVCVCVCLCVFRGGKGKGKGRGKPLLHFHLLYHHHHQHHYFRSSTPTLSPYKLRNKGQSIMSGRLIILPHKSWHVWNKDNLARVEKDEALNEEKRRLEGEKVQKAEGEARLSLLKKRARILRGEGDQGDDDDNNHMAAVVVVEEKGRHVNLFEDVEMLEDALVGGGLNKDGKRDRLSVGDSSRSSFRDEDGRNNKKRGKEDEGPVQARTDDLFGRVTSDNPWYNLVTSQVSFSERDGCAFAKFPIPHTLSIKDHDVQVQWTATTLSVTVRATGAVLLHGPLKHPIRIPSKRESCETRCYVEDDKWFVIQLEKREKALQWNQLFTAAHYTHLPNNSNPGIDRSAEARAREIEQRRQRADEAAKSRDDPMYRMKVVLEVKKQVEEINEKHGGIIEGALLVAEQREARLPRDGFSAKK